MRSPCRLLVSPFVSTHLSVYPLNFCWKAQEITLLCASPQIFSFSTRPMSYQRKVGD
jgi:hypothetical protein